MDFLFVSCAASAGGRDDDVMTPSRTVTSDRVTPSLLTTCKTRERERERESFIRNNLHNGVVSGAARGQALRGPMWAGLTPDSKGDPTGDTGGLIAADRRHHTCLRDAREHCRPLQAARQVPGKKN